MTTYTTIGTASLAVGKPLTSTIALAMRDNPLAIAEADASVDLSLLPTVLLGTLNTTSGSAQTLSSLVLTPFKFILVVANGVSTTAGGVTVGLGADPAIFGTLAGAFSTISGMAWVDLGTGRTTAISNGVVSGASGYSTATTSISVNTTGTFDAGSVRIYGLK